MEALIQTKFPGLLSQTFQKSKKTISSFLCLITEIVFTNIIQKYNIKESLLK